MGSINKAGHFFFHWPMFFLALFLFAAGSPLAGQSVHLGPEIERLEGLAQSPSLKHAVSVRLARLYALSGNREKALENWLNAANAQGARDNNAMLEAIKLYIAMGEFEKAAGELKLILGSGSIDENTRAAAVLIGAQLEVFRTGNAAPLTGLAAGSVHSEASGIFYTLWKATGSETWKARLIDAFPRSVEAEIAGGTSGVKPAATPQWLFLAQPANSAAVVVTTVPPAATAAGNSAAGEPGAVRLQTGLFGRESNARAMAARLTAAGFGPEVVRRSLSGGDYWAVYVPSGPNMNQSISQLKSAGFESFPVFD